MHINSWSIVAHVWMYCCYLLVIAIAKSSAESLARRQNAVVFIYPNDIVLLSLTSSSLDWLYSSFLLIVMSLLMSSSLRAPAGLYRSSSNLRLFLASVPAGPLIDVPASPPSFFSACSWFLSFQLVHYAPAGSTWPPPDYEQLTQLWTSPLLI
ncbi:hypothetical protein F511_17603 [Dorcoceras hygrometricum]|uniref:Uncharacterized protein n=1 Tax=Dorcoceras hygrometricum TaxID=472368 RepID=A0A2Z7AJU0_9LAMI|nr:hypothetical protein F511_17603 [Dorcoceras hygrometricum]